MNPAPSNSGVPPEVEAKPFPSKPPLQRAGGSVDERDKPRWIRAQAGLELGFSGSDPMLTQWSSASTPFPSCEGRTAKEKLRLALSNESEDGLGHAKCKTTTSADEVLASRTASKSRESSTSSRRDLGGIGRKISGTSVGSHNAVKSFAISPLKKAATHSPISMSSAELGPSPPCTTASSGSSSTSSSSKSSRGVQPLQAVSKSMSAIAAKARKGSAKSIIEIKRKASQSLRERQLGKTLSGGTHKGLVADDCFWRPPLPTDFNFVCKYDLAAADKPESPFVT